MPTGLEMLLGICPTEMLVEVYVQSIWIIIVRCQFGAIVIVL